MENLLLGKVAFITGCDKGIGLCICREFVSEGAIVYANVLEEASKERVLEECGHQNGQVIPVCFDITDKTLIMECIKTIKKEQNKLDIVVNNAGVKKDGLVEMIDTASINRMFEVNVTGVIQVTQAALKLMKRNPEGGSIVNVSSIVGLRGNRGQSVYGATKGAVASLTKSWAKELAPQKIRVNAVAPGSIDTDMFYTMSDETIQESINAIGMKRLGKPEEVAKTILFLASDLASYVTGEIVGVNGGLFM